MAKGQVKIDQMYAFIALDPADSTEGVTAFLSPEFGNIPMVGADMARVDSLRPVAEELARVGKLKITLCRFSVREELETFDGGSS